ncbi:hypothetical protein J4P02_19200 [Pseudomonas sp. NFXW11]|uniref:hypothetical protein n=1 Tax=Pseudomonas sp. NFXW11 TaxID=2819531 RepID=UPI003CF92A9E
MNELIQLHDAMASTIKAAMPQLLKVEAAPGTPDGSVVPAVYFSISAMDHSADPGDGRSGLKASFEARLLVDPNLARAPLQAAILAAQLMDLLRGQYWDLDFVDGVTAMQAKPAPAPEASALKNLWLVQWQQVIYLGQEQWPWPNQPPGSLALGFSPDTGLGNRDRYQSPEQME